MTFKDLQKVIESETGSAKTAENNQILRKLRGRVFWEWGTVEHKRMDRASNGNCCFNYIIGLPKKDGIQKPLFDYEKILLGLLSIKHWMIEQDFKL